MIMKSSNFILSILLVGLIACNQATTNNQMLQNRIDNLEKKLTDMYKPGLGEFMSGIQVHHAKLWFAGQNQNWLLADFEINEIKENLLAIENYCTDRPEIQSIKMIYPPIDSLDRAIQSENLNQFKSSYQTLTNACNNCHQLTSHAFNVITIPESPPFSNQDFKSNR
jgi:hypothetical protein